MTLYEDQLSRVELVITGLTQLGSPEPLLNEVLAQAYRYREALQTEGSDAIIATGYILFSNVLEQLRSYSSNDRAAAGLLIRSTFFNQPNLGYNA